MRYLQRMGLFNLLDVDTGRHIEAREEAGRFIPLRVIRSSAELRSFMVDLVPLFHTNPQQAAPIQYVISELVRNTLEHSGPSPVAVVAAQVFQNSEVVAIGVADMGRGIRSSLSATYGTRDDLTAIQLSMRPGITGTTRRLGGTADNAGAGLFFCKAMALTSRNHIVLHSGTGLFKLLVTPPGQAITVIPADPRADRATRHDDANQWPGTLVGIDLRVNAYQEFTDFMRFVGDAYDVDVCAEKKAQAKARARFT